MGDGWRAYISIHNSHRIKIYFAEFFLVTIFNRINGYGRKEQQVPTAKAPPPIRRTNRRRN